jgi:hypothetical protein
MHPPLFGNVESWRSQCVCRTPCVNDSTPTLGVSKRFLSAYLGVQFYSSSNSAFEHHLPKPHQYFLIRISCSQKALFSLDPEAVAVVVRGTVSYSFLPLLPSPQLSR